MLNLAVFFGGRSIEHEISVITALQAFLALDPQKYRLLPVYLALNGKWYTGDPLFERAFYQKLPGALSELTEITLLPDPSVGGLISRKTNKVLPVDRCLLCFHGQYGEDGCVQGLLELAELPYTGSRVLASALCMSKSHSKDLLRSHNIPVLPHVLLNKEETSANLRAATKKILERLEFPLFVKPNHLGSSIGIAKAESLPALDQALANVFAYDSHALIEPYIETLVEINVSVLDESPPQVSVVEIPVKGEFALSYQDKYMRKGSKNKGSSSQGLAELTRVIDPKDLDPAIKVSVIRYAKEAFQILHCSGVCRFDFMWDASAHQLYFNEVNPIPGSLSFYLWDKSAPSLLYTQLLDKMIERCTYYPSIQRSLKKEFGFHALST